MDKKQTIFLSAILGIGSIMMLSFLIISATKANPECKVNDDLVVTGSTTLGDALTDATTVSGIINALSHVIIDKDLNVKGDSNLGFSSGDKVKAYQYCDESGSHCHDASAGWEGSLSCVTNIDTVIGSGTTECGGDYVMTGGGCEGNSIIVDMPMISSGNGWYCHSSDSNEIISVRVRCCKIN